MAERISLLPNAPLTLKLNSIQYLRALAAVLVVANHASTSLLDREVSLVPLGVGEAGVDIFFVISGFIMVYTTYLVPLTTDKFLIKRVMRVAPLYTLLTTLFFLLACAFPHEVKTVSGDFGDYVKSILYIPFYNIRTHHVFPVLGQGWTLNYEMFFYLIFAIGLAFSYGRRVAGVVGALCVLALAGLCYSGSNILALSYTSSLLLEFGYGIVLAAFFIWQRMAADRGSKLLLGLISLLLVGTAVLVVFETASVPRSIYYGVPGAAIVLALIWLERLGWRFESKSILVIGDASYSLYLVHGFVMAAMRRIWQQLFEIQTVRSHVAFILVSTIASILAAIALYRFLEKPMTEYLNRTLRARRI